MRPINLGFKHCSPAIVIIQTKKCHKESSHISGHHPPSTVPSWIKKNTNSSNQNHETTENTQPQEPSTMHFPTILPIFLALATTIAASALHPSSGGDLVWDEYLFLQTIGAVPTVSGKYPFETLPPDYYGRGCYGEFEGRQVCGSFEENGVDALRAIYRCKNGKFELEETCHEKSKNNRCVRNKRGVRQWKKFYPFVSSDKIVCVSEKGLKMT